MFTVRQTAGRRRSRAVSRDANDVPDMAALTLNTTPVTSNQATTRVFTKNERYSIPYLIGITIQGFLRKEQARFTHCQLLSASTFKWEMPDLYIERKTRVKKRLCLAKTADLAILPQLLFSLLRISQLQMWSENLTPVHALTSKYLPGEWETPDYVWQSLTSEAIWCAVQNEIMRWKITFDFYIARLKLDAFMRLGTNLDQFNDRFDLAYGAVENSAKGIFSFFEELVKLISDVAHRSHRHRSDDLKTLGKLPTRQTVLQDIVSQAPANKDLAVAVLVNLLSMNREKRECGICLGSWDENVDPELLKVYGTAKEEKSEWLTVVEDQLVVKKGFEGVPLKMKCGHTFCAGCIKTWLDTPGRLSCPYRDEEYGIYRSPALTLITDLKAAYQIEEVSDGAMLEHEKT